MVLTVVDTTYIINVIRRRNRVLTPMVSCKGVLSFGKILCSSFVVHELSFDAPFSTVEESSLFLDLAQLEI